jgi:hypothetical protein
MGATINQPSDNFRKVLFGEGLNEIVIRRLSLATGISESTLRNWKKRPWQISLEGAALIAKARGLTDDQMLALFK